MVLLLDIYPASSTPRKKHQWETIATNSISISSRWKDEQRSYIRPVHLARNKTRLYKPTPQRLKCVVYVECLSVYRSFRMESKYRHSSRMYTIPSNFLISVDS